MDHPCTLGAAVCHQALPCPLYTQPRARRVWVRRNNCLKIVDSNPRYPAWKSCALTTRPPSPLVFASTAEYYLYSTQWRKAHTQKETRAADAQNDLGFLRRACLNSFRLTYGAFCSEKQELKWRATQQKEKKCKVFHILSRVLASFLQGKQLLIVFLYN